MINIQAVKVGILDTNCYIVSGGKDNECVLIDPGEDAAKIQVKLQALNLSPVAILLTHAHFDHTKALRNFQSKECKVYLHPGDEFFIAPEKYQSSIYRKLSNQIAPDESLYDGQELNLAGLTIKVIHTPGHSGACVCFVLGDNIFSGDTLFYLSVGRTDLPCGDSVKMKNSLAKLFSLDRDYSVFPGHGEKTSLNFERKNNPYA